MELFFANDEFTAPQQTVFSKLSTLSTLQKAARRLSISVVAASSSSSPLGSGSDK
jgi:hypothetical protein